MGPSMRFGAWQFVATFLLGPGLVATLAGVLSAHATGVAAAIGIAYLVLAASEVGAAAWLERFGWR